MFKLIDRLDKYFERTWVATASWVTASSLPIADSITALTGVRSETLANGFNEGAFEGIRSDTYETFTITYVGTLYEGQKVEIFCDAFKRLLDSTPGAFAKLYFVGLAFYGEQAERVAALMRGYEDYTECTPRRDRSAVLEVETRSHLLLHAAWNEQRTYCEQDQ